MSDPAKLPTIPVPAGHSHVQIQETEPRAAKAPELARTGVARGGMSGSWDSMLDWRKPSVQMVKVERAPDAFCDVCQRPLYFRGGGVNWISRGGVPICVPCLKVPTIKLAIRAMPRHERGRA